MAFGAVTRPLNEVSAEALGVDRVSRQRMVDPRHIKEFPDADPAADREGEAHRIRRSFAGDRRQRAQKGEEIADVLGRHAAIGRDKAEPDRDVRRSARRRPSARWRNLPPSQPPIPSCRSGVMLGGWNEPNGVFSSRPPPRRSGSLCPGDMVAGFAAGDVEDVFPRFGVARLRHRRRDFGGDTARGGGEPRRGRSGGDEDAREA